MTHLMLLLSQGSLRFGFWASQVVLGGENTDQAQIPRFPTMHASLDAIKSNTLGFPRIGSCD